MWFVCSFLLYGLAVFIMIRSQGYYGRQGPRPIAEALFKKNSPKKHHFVFELGELKKGFIDEKTPIFKRKQGLKTEL